MRNARRKAEVRRLMIEELNGYVSLSAIVGGGFEKGALDSSERSCGPYKCANPGAWSAVRHYLESGSGLAPGGLH